MTMKALKTCLLLSVLAVSNVFFDSGVNALGVDSEFQGDKSLFGKGHELLFGAL